MMVYENLLLTCKIIFIFIIGECPSSTTNIATVTTATKHSASGITQFTCMLCAKSI